jgi:hypothetical protein
MTRIWLISADEEEDIRLFPLHPLNPRSIHSLSDRLLGRSEAVRLTKADFEGDISFGLNIAVSSRFSTQEE